MSQTRDDAGVDETSTFPAQLYVKIKPKTHKKILEDFKLTQTGKPNNPWISNRHLRGMDDIQQQSKNMMPPPVISYSA